MNANALKPVTHTLAEVLVLNVYSAEDGDGYYIQDQCSMGEVAIPKDPTEEQVITALVEDDWLTERLGKVAALPEGFHADIAEGWLLVCHKENGRPLLKLVW